MEKTTTIGMALVIALVLIQSVAPADASTDADFILIRKSERTLSLIRGADAFRTFPISLGANPSGHKQEAGDARTPEGRYFVEYKNADSRYFLSLKISYPNKHDKSRAQTLGISPGGNIMIHGMPDEPRFSPDYYRHVDWTDGCIAVSNAAMSEIWRAVTEFTPVVIYP